MGTLGLRRYLYSSSLWRICSLAEVPGGVYSRRTDEQSSPALLRSSHRPSRTPETFSARPSAQSSVARQRQKISERRWRFMAWGILKMSMSAKGILPVFAPRSSSKINDEHFYFVRCDQLVWGPRYQKTVHNPDQ